VIDWHEHITKAELVLLATWVRGPRFRTLWTPDPSDMFSMRGKAIAAACKAIESQGLAHGDAGMALIAQLHSSGDLAKHWPPGSAPLPVATSTDPDADLRRWREQRCLFALRSSLVESLSSMTPGGDLSEARRRVLEAAEAARPNERSRGYSRAEEATMAVAGATRHHTNGQFSGFTGLDRATGGLRPGNVWVLGAPTNWGKSSFLIAVREHHLSVHGGGVLLVTCEDAPELLAARVLARNARLLGNNVRDACLTAQELERAHDYLTVSTSEGNPPLVLLDGRGRSVEQIAFEVRAGIARHGISLVLVDYLQCISTERVTQDRRAEINHIARTLTDAIKTSGAAGILASQLTGEDIRESRDVEHAAEVVLIGRGGKEEPREIFIKKNKTGPAQYAVPLTWDDDYGGFSTAEQVEW
jgi:replicative DNA helicase